MRFPPIIYLDSQDFSRFGDVLRAKADEPTEKLFLNLESRVAAGDVIFAVSMPVLAELLQYDAAHRQTTMCKAEAVERLCGNWALAYPTRLVASELASAARSRGIGVDLPAISPLSSDRYWYPNVSSAFEGLKTRMENEIRGIVDQAELESRYARRKARKFVKTLRPSMMVGAVNRAGFTGGRGFWAVSIG